MPAQPTPRWEALAIILTVLALLPASISLQMARPLMPVPVAWGVLAASLALMLLIFVRRVRRLKSLGSARPDDAPRAPFPPAPPQGRP